MAAKHCFGSKQLQQHSTFTETLKNWGTVLYVFVSADISISIITWKSMHRCISVGTGNVRAGVILRASAEMRLQQVTPDDVVVTELRIITRGAHPQSLYSLHKHMKHQ